MTTAIPVILKDTAGNYVLPQSYQIKATAETLGSVRVGSGLSMSSDGVLSITADSTKANTSLNNLSSDGQMIVDSVNGTISNCVLEIPQNIHLTLENNVLTLKAGSIITRYGEGYVTVTTTEDKVHDYSSASNGRYVQFAGRSTGNLGYYKEISLVGSGDSLPADNSTYSIFYLTTDKKIYFWNTGTSDWGDYSGSYPICLIDVNNGVASFAKDSNGNDMIFNGACFIGHHAVVYPNVTVFHPNGYSDAKHLNSVKITTNQLYVTELNTTNNCLSIATYSQQVARIKRGADLNDKNLITTNNEYHYITTENYIYSKTSSGYVQRPLMFFVDYTYNGTTVTDFTIRQPIRLATTEMLDKVQTQVDTKQDMLVSGTNIKTVGGTSLLGSGDVAFPTVDQSYSGTSANAQSGVAIKSAIDAAISSVYKPCGSVVFASLPTPGSTNEGYVYNITDAFTTTSSFVEGAGIDYPSGTNVAVIMTDQTNYYAWYLTSLSTLVYTTSATPSAGDAIYNFNFVLTDDTIKSVESDYSSILWKSDGVTLTATRQSSNDTNSTTYKYDTLTGAFQPLLVSGTNIKTVNNESILGSGNVTISASPTFTYDATTETLTIS